MHNPVVPDIGRVELSCLNIQSNVATMTGTVQDPVSTDAFTGAPWFRPPGWWIVGAYLVVVDNGDAPPQMFSGFFVNPDKTHVISTPRCFGGGLVPAALLPVDAGHVEVRSAAG
jgi:hypothetical protein